MNDVCLDGAERLVFDDNEDLLFFFQVDEVTKPGFLGKSVGKDKKKKKKLPDASFYTAVYAHSWRVFVFLTPFCTNPSIYPSIYPSVSAALGRWKGANRGYLKGKELKLCREGISF